MHLTVSPARRTTDSTTIARPIPGAAPALSVRSEARGAGGPAGIMIRAASGRMATARPRSIFRACPATIATVSKRERSGCADISVRNNEAIDVQKSEGQAFSGAIYEDVLDEKGDVAIPKGSYAKLIVRNNSDQFLAVDLELVEVNGMRYEVITDGYRTDGDPRGLEANARTGNVVDGAKLVGAFTQLLSPGRTGKIPAQSFLTFHLERSLALGSGAEDFMHRGQH